MPAGPSASPGTRQADTTAHVEKQARKRSRENRAQGVTSMAKPRGRPGPWTDKQPSGLDRGWRPAGPLGARAGAAPRPPPDTRRVATGFANSTPHACTFRCLCRGTCVFLLCSIPLQRTEYRLKTIMGTTRISASRIFSTNGRKRDH